MLHDIEWLKGFPTQIEKVGKIEWGGGANGNVDSNIVIDKGTEVDGKDVIKKKRFKDISK